MEEDVIAMMVMKKYKIVVVMKTCVHFLVDQILLQA